MKTDVLIIGGGLAGLAIARLFEQRGVAYELIEARPRFGGRILSQSVTINGETAAFDLGPAWFWPGQPRIAELLDSLGLQHFLQHASGDITAEDENGRVVRGAGFASMEGSLRLDGGLGCLIDGLVAALPDNRLALGQVVRQISFEDGTVVTAAHTEDGEIRSIESRCAVVALLPRVVADTIQLPGEITAAAKDAMRAIPTWMAGHAKILAIYGRPHWRDDGLSGDAMSRRGPMVEIHDASPAAGGPYALFGFVGYSPDARAQLGGGLAEHARDQLGRLFGDAVAEPDELIIRDWAFDELTATPLDHASSNHHPAYGLPAALSGLCDGRVILGSTETAPEFGGYLEGALEAAEIAMKKVETCLE